jgi:hypothetical protein
VPAPKNETPRLPVVEVLRVVWYVYRRHWKFLIPLSVIVLAPQAVADAVFADVQVTEVKSIDDVLTLASFPIAVAINLGGEALYAGIVAAAVVAWLRGRELRNVPGAIRSIAYGRLIAIDVILALGTALGLVLLIVPGVLIFTYFAVSPALIELDGITVREALRRSPRLVRGNFWRVLGFTMIVLLLAELITALLESPIHDVHGEVVFNLLIEAVIEPFQGLTTVFLALALLGLHGQDGRLQEFVERQRSEG